MRNGNGIVPGFDTRLRGRVLTVPMRNGNFEARARTAVIFRAFLPYL